MSKPLSFHGDPHNFGRKVVRVETSEGPHFLKPRTVFWEKLLFGKSSELLSHLKQSVSTDHLASSRSPVVSKYFKLFEESIFGLEVNENGRSAGQVKEVSDDALALRSLAENELLLTRAGFLIAYCYVFGVQDLHRGNVFVTDGRLQVLDAEVVFSDLTLPNETLLLPFRSHSLEKSGFGLLLDSPGKKYFDLIELRQIVSGYVAGMQFLYGIVPFLNDALNEIETFLAEIPVRTILRPTREYSLAAAGTLEDLTWIEEERSQFARNDIPYFFKFLGKSEVYYYNSSELAYCPAMLTAELETQAARVGCQPSRLIDRYRIKSKLFAPGLLLLLRKLNHSDGEFTFESADQFAKIVVNEKYFRLESQWGSFETKRIRGMR